jgi:mono/diheme cytochrome c family protein
MYKYFIRLPKLLFFSLVALLFFTASLQAQDGKALFQGNCSSCHAIFTKSVGPALTGVNKRHSEEWLLKWVRNSGAMIKSGDPDAVKLFNDNNHIAMPAQNLKDEEITAIINYVSNEKAPPRRPVLNPALNLKAVL